MPKAPSPSLSRLDRTSPDIYRLTSPVSRWHTDSGVLNATDSAERQRVNMQAMGIEEMKSRHGKTAHVMQIPVNAQKPRSMKKNVYPTQRDLR